MSYGELKADEGKSALAGFVFYLDTAITTDQILIFIFCKLSYFSEHHTNLLVKLESAEKNVNGYILVNISPMKTI